MCPQTVSQNKSFCLISSCCEKNAQAKAPYGRKVRLACSLRVQTIVVWKSRLQKPEATSCKSTVSCRKQLIDVCLYSGVVFLYLVVCPQWGSHPTIINVKKAIPPTDVGNLFKTTRTEIPFSVTLHCVSWQSEPTIMLSSIASVWYVTAAIRKVTDQPPMVPTSKYC